MLEERSGTSQAATGTHQHGACTGRLVAGVWQVGCLTKGEAAGASRQGWAGEGVRLPVAPPSGRVLTAASPRSLFRPARALCPLQARVSGETPNARAGFRKRLSVKYSQSENVAALRGVPGVQ